MKLFVHFIPYIVISIIDLYACFYHIQNLIYISKPLVLLYLFYFYLTFNTKQNLLIMFGLILSLAGDIYLMFNELFWEGIIVFWLSDVLYVIALYKVIKCGRYSHTFKVLPVLFGLYLFVFLFLPFKSLYPYLGTLAVPVAVYGITLMTMNVFAMGMLVLEGVNRWNVILFVSTICYMVSDYILLHGMVVEEIEHELFFVMLSYVIAQGGIIYCFVSREREGC